MNDSLALVLASPSPATLWRLRGRLLETGLDPDSPTWELLDRFHEFLSGWQASTSAHEYSSLASYLDMGAVGGVALQSLLESGQETADLWKKLIAGGLSEGLMVLASRQYVRAATAELEGVYRAAAWYLYQALWRLSAQLQPDLSPSSRRQHIEVVLAPVQQPETKAAVKLVLVGRLFQALLLIYLKMDQV